MDALLRTDRLGEISSTLIAWWLGWARGWPATLMAKPQLESGPEFVTALQDKAGYTSEQSRAIGQ